MFMKPLWGPQQWLRPDSARFCEYSITKVQKTMSRTLKLSSKYEFLVDKRIVLCSGEIEGILLRTLGWEQVDAGR